MISKPLANLGHLIFLANGGKKFKSEWINDYELHRKIGEAREIIPQKAAQIYLELQKKGKIPIWVEEITNAEIMKYAAY